MKNTLKNIQSWLFAILIMVGICLIAFLFIEGGAWLTEKIYPWVSIAFAVTLLITLFVLLPLAAFRKTRGFASSSIYTASFIFGFTLWVWGFLLTYTLWGHTAVFIGLFLAGVGVVPFAMLATLFKGLWSTFGGLILLTVITFGARFFAIYLATKSEDYD